MHSKSKEVELDYKLPHLDCVKSKVIKASFRCLVILCKMRGSWLVNELFCVFISLKTFSLLVSIGFTACRHFSHSS